MKQWSIFIGFLMFMFLGPFSVEAATLDVDMGNNDAPCNNFGPSDIGFVDCTSGSGGLLLIATTAATAGDTVQWTMRSTPHTTTSQAALGGGPAAACGTGDNFDSGVGNAFT